MWNTRIWSVNHSPVNLTVAPLRNGALPVVHIEMLCKRFGMVCGEAKMNNITQLRGADAARSDRPTAAAGAAAAETSKPPYLADLLMDTSPERMAKQLVSFRTAVHDSLFVSSKVYRLLSDLEKSNLADCATCTEKLRHALVNNPHYIVLKKLEEAERLLVGLDRRSN